MNNFLKKILFFLVKKRIYYNFNKKINRIFYHNKKYIVRNKQKESQNISKWGVFGNKINLKWYLTYSSISKIEDSNFVPEDIYYGDIERILNDSKFNFAYADKNRLSDLVNKNLIPKTYLHNIDGVFYDSDKISFSINDVKLFEIISATEKLIIKKSFDSAGGKAVELIYRNGDSYFLSNGKKFNLNFLKKEHVKNYIIQEYISQHPYYMQFNQTSVNTIRVMTYRSVINEDINVLHSVLRFGAKNKLVDNQAAGGFSCGISIDGQLNDFYIDKSGSKYKLSDLSKNSEIKNVHRYNEIIEIAISNAKLFPYHRLLGFDFCIDKYDNIKLLEVNNQSIEINFIQMSCGPLFGKYTDEIIKYCLINNVNSTINDF